MLNPIFEKVLRPFNPSTSPKPTPQILDPVRRDEARELLADLLPERDEWGVER